MNHLLRDDDGATAVTVALVIVMLILFAAIAVDLGYAYSVRRQLQTAADAAALAGCRVLADGGDEGAVLAEVEAYAQNNAVQPADELYVVDGAPETEVGVDFVQVTVEKDTPLFFGRIMGSNSTLVRTVSRAQIAYLTGLRGIVPWGVPIIRATKVSVSIGGGSEIWLEDRGEGLWSKTISTPGVAAPTGYLMDVTVYNNQTEYPDGTVEYPDGVPEVAPGVTSVFVRPADCPISDVYLDRYVVTAGTDSTVRLYVRCASEPSVRFAGKNVNASEVVGSPDLWTATLMVPDAEATEKLLTTYPVDVTVDKYTVNSAAVVALRRSTYPVLDVALSDYVTGPGGSTTVSVLLNEYVYGERYAMRVAGGGGETGNFCALDLSTVRHTPNWLCPQHPAEYDVTTDPNYKPPTYYCYLENRYPFVIHLGDTIWTEPGALSGPQSSSALEVRFDGDDRTFAEWLASGDESSNRIVYVPVMEKMQNVTGTSPLRVVSIASFYIEPESNIKKNDIVGRFLKYVAPSDAISEDPPDGLNVRTVRLVPPQ
jgi:Flp pilus assembly protein TadG